MVASCPALQPGMRLATAEQHRCVGSLGLAVIDSRLAAGEPSVERSQLSGRLCDGRSDRLELAETRESDKVCILLELLFFFVYGCEDGHDLGSATMLLLATAACSLHGGCLRCHFGTGGTFVHRTRMDGDHLVPHTSL